MRAPSPIGRRRTRLEDLPRAREELAALQRREIDQLAVEHEFDDVPTEAKRPAHG